MLACARGWWVHPIEKNIQMADGYSNVEGRQFVFSCVIQVSVFLKVFTPALKQREFYNGRRFSTKSEISVSPPIKLSMIIGLDNKWAPIIVELVEQSTIPVWLTTNIDPV